MSGDVDADIQSLEAEFAEIRGLETSMDDDPIVVDQDDGDLDDFEAQLAKLEAATSARKRPADGSTRPSRPQRPGSAARRPQQASGAPARRRITELSPVGERSTDGGALDSGGAGSGEGSLGRASGGVGGDIESRSLLPIDDVPGDAGADAHEPFRRGDISAIPARDDDDDDDDGHGDGADVSDGHSGGGGSAEHGPGAGADGADAGSTDGVDELRRSHGNVARRRFTHEEMEWAARAKVASSSESSPLDDAAQADAAWRQRHAQRQREIRKLREEIALLEHLPAGEYDRFMASRVAPQDTVEGDDGDSTAKGAAPPPGVGTDDDSRARDAALKTQHDIDGIEPAWLSSDAYGNGMGSAGAGGVVIDGFGDSEAPHALDQDILRLQDLQAEMQRRVQHKENLRRREERRQADMAGEQGHVNVMGQKYERFIGYREAIADKLEERDQREEEAGGAAIMRAVQRDRVGRLAKALLDPPPLARALGVPEVEGGTAGIEDPVAAAEGAGFQADRAAAAFPLPHDEEALDEAVAAHHRAVEAMKTGREWWKLVLPHTDAGGVETRDLREVRYAVPWQEWRAVAAERGVEGAEELPTMTRKVEALSGHVGDTPLLLVAPTDASAGAGATPREDGSADGREDGSTTSGGGSRGPPSSAADARSVAQRASLGVETDVEASHKFVSHVIGTLAPSAGSHALSDPSVNAAMRKLGMIDPWAAGTSALIVTGGRFARKPDRDAGGSGDGGDNDGGEGDDGSDFNEEEDGWGFGEENKGTDEDAAVFARSDPATKPRRMPKFTGIDAEVAQQTETIRAELDKALEMGTGGLRGILAVVREQDAMASLVQVRVDVECEPRCQRCLVLLV